MTQSQKDSIIIEAVKEFDDEVYFRHEGDCSIFMITRDDCDCGAYRERNGAIEIFKSQLSKAIDLAEKATLEERENIEG